MEPIEIEDCSSLQDLSLEIEKGGVGPSRNFDYRGAHAGYRLSLAYGDTKVEKKGGFTTDRGRIDSTMEHKKQRLNKELEELKDNYAEICEKTGSVIIDLESIVDDFLGGEQES